MQLPTERLQPDGLFVPSLNGIRAGSIALVLASHYISQWVPGAPSISGQLGVTVFFVVSGFLIARLLLAEYGSSGSISILKFYARRALRLAPVLLVFLGVMILFGFALNEETGPAALCAAAYLTNYCNTFEPQIFKGYGQYLLGTWSLSVEEQFYLMAAPAMAFALRGSIFWRYAIALLPILISPIIRLLYAQQGFDVEMIMFNAEARIDSLAYGVLAAVTASHDAGRRVIRKLIGTFGLVLLVILALVAVQMKRSYSLEWFLTHSFLAAALSLAIVNLIYNPQLKLFAGILNWTISDWVGKISYSLYLWHFWAMMVVDQTRLYGWAKVACATALAFGSAALSYYTVERYFLKFRKDLS